MVYTVIFMVIVGAAIGGITNHLAIKMLFRPYQAIYIGKWRLPFTPGIIPRRRDELSVQLGDMVVKHLLTTEGVRKKLEDEDFKEKVRSWVREEAKKFLTSGVTIRELISKQTKIENLESHIQEKVKNYAFGRYEHFITKNQESSLVTLLPENIDRQVKSKIPHLADVGIKRAIEYIKSEEADDKIEKIVEQILEEKKVIKGFVNMFVGNGKVIDKVKVELIHLLNKETTKESVVHLLEREWSIFIETPLETHAINFDLKAVYGILEERIIEGLPLSKYLDRTMNEWTVEHQDYILNDVLIRNLDNVGLVVFKRTEEILKQFDLSAIVKKQVEGFPIQRLEELILGIVSKEFKMITYLGAFLGGVIGLIQAFSVVMFQ